MREPMKSSASRPTKEEIRQRLTRIRDGIRITRITCTRAVKGRNGDSFVGFSASWQSIQDDRGGPGTDLLAEPEDERVLAQQGATIKDARIARYLLAIECDVAALESAVANGSITPGYFRDAVRSVRENYNGFILREMGVSRDDDNGDPEQQS